MKIAILTSGVLPVPAVQGGAVENLIDFCLEYNEKHHLHDITIYSVDHPKLKHHPALCSKFNHYYHININNFWSKIGKRLYRILNRDNSYYHYSVEYFFSRSYNNIRKHHYDIIIIENRPGYVLKLIGTSARLVLHQGNDYLNTQVPHFQEIYDSFNCIINTSFYLTERVKSINPLDKKCITIFNGIDVQRFYEVPSLSRNQIGLDEKDFVIVYSGRLTAEKGILQLIRAIKQLDDIPRLKLLIIGASAYGIDKYPNPFIKQLVEESEPIKEKVVFTGFIDYSKVPSYLKCASIAVVPSMWDEPFGLTVVEALAAGLPLITTRSGGIPEICEGIAMIIERKSIVKNLTKAILDLYQHPEKMKQMSEASLRHSMQFDKEIYARNYFTAIERI